MAAVMCQQNLGRINAVVVRAGHALVKKSPDEGLAVRGDAFVVATDVHYPTDTHWLYDAVRKVIQTRAGRCADAGLSDWRQQAYHVRCLKKAYRHTQQVKRSRAQDEAKRAAREVEIRQAHAAYLALAARFLARARVTRLTLIGYITRPRPGSRPWMTISPRPSGRSTRSGAGC
jgi:transposase, IS5 family